MKYYFCDDNKHTRQVCTDRDDPKCTICGAVMTYGQFTKDYINFTKIKPGTHQAIDGLHYYIDRPFIMEC